jgi:hypothetical protein
MKKFIGLCLAGLLILALAAPGYAQAPKLEFKASGYIDTQTFWMEGVPQRNTSAGTYGVTNGNYASGTPAVINVKAPGWNRTDSHWDARAHLKFDAVMGPNLSGTIYFEIDTARWGALHSNYPGNGREANNFGSWSTDRTALEVKNIYIDFGLPYFGIPVPVTVRVGAQPIGVRPNVFLYTDGTGVTAGIKIDPVTIMPIYAKALEGLDFADDDVDVWGLHVNSKISTFTVGAYGLNYRMNTYPFYVTNPNPTVQSNFINALQAPALIPSVPGTMKSHMWWLGTYVDGKAGPVNLNLDFVYDYGSVDERVLRDLGEGRPGGGPFVPTIPNVKYEGWMVRGKLDFPWEKFNFGMVGMYATGSDARRTSSSGLPGTTTAAGPGFQILNPISGIGSHNITRRVTAYVVPPGAEQDTSNNESIVVYGMDNGASGGVGIAKDANYATLSRGGFGGTWFAKLYASMKLLPWYKLTVQGLYIGDTTKNGDTFGNSVKYLQAIPAGYASLGIPQSTTFLRDNTDIGWEFDLINEIQIYNNLKFTLGYGYLFAGDALDVRMGHNASFPSLAGSVPGNRKADNPWAVRTRLMYTF